MNKIVCIYIIENTADGKVYIGQTVNYRIRKKSHFVNLRRGTHSNEHLQNAFNKFGEKCFSIRILQECGENELDDLERSYIAKYDSTNRTKGYNIFEGGERPGYRRHNKETRAKMSRAGKGRKFSEEHKRHIGESNKGKKMPKEAIERIKAIKAERGSQSGEKNGNAVISNAVAEKIIKELLKGAEVNSLAEKYNVSEDVVYNILYNKSYKLIMPEVRKELAERVQRAFEERLEKAVDAYINGKSQNAVAKEFGVSRNSLRKELLKRGIDTQIHINQSTTKR